MAFTFGFYDSVNGDRAYSAKQFSQFFDGIITDGVFEHIGGHFNVTASSGMVVNVASGRAWLNQKWLLNDVHLPITIDASEPILNRIDSIIFTIDEVSRTASISVLKGTPASTPVQPGLTNSADHFEYRIANIYVGATVTSITDANITNFVGQSGLPYVVMAPEFAQYSDTNPLMDGTASPGTARTIARSDHRHPVDTSRAPINSPNFTGTPKALTASDNTNTTQIATTEFVMRESAKKAATASPTFTGTASFASATFSGTVTAQTPTAGDNSTKVATTAFVNTALSGKANLASPTFTGDPKAPTPSVGDNDTSIATTAFVHANPRNKMYTATCPTAAATAAKVATIDGSSVGFSLATGVRVAVTFTNGHDPWPSGSLIKATLNVNNTGAKTIVISDVSNLSDIHTPNKYETSGNSIRWSNNETVIFTYTGSYWLMLPSSLQYAESLWYGMDYYEYGFSRNDTAQPNKVLAGPASGSSSGAIAMRNLVASDLPIIPISKLSGSNTPVNSLLISDSTNGSTVTYREMIHLTAYDGKIPASADGTVAESVAVTTGDTRILTAGSLARIGGRIVPRNVGGSPGDTMWRLSRLYSIDYFNDTAYNPSINGMIHFFYE